LVLDFIIHTFLHPIIIIFSQYMPDNESQLEVVLPVDVDYCIQAAMHPTVLKTATVENVAYIFVWWIALAVFSCLHCSLMTLRHS